MTDGEGPDRLFTVVCDYDGGTYISQVAAPDERAAAANWAKAFREEKKAPKGAKRITKDVLGRLDTDPPTLLEGLSGVWCVTALARDKLALINIIRSA